MLNSVSGSQNTSFGSIYKYTAPDNSKLNNPDEIKAYSELDMGTVMLGLNNSIDEAKVSKTDSSIYFKIDDKKDLAFEKGFKDIVDNCNKTFNTDLASKAYLTKVSEEEYKNAIPLNMKV